MIAEQKIDNRWEIIEYFENPSNAELLHSLSKGVSALRVNFTKPLDREKTELLFEGIHTDFIELYLEGDSETVLHAEKLTNKIASKEIFIFNNVNFAAELQLFLDKARKVLEDANESEQPRISFHMNSEYLDNIAKVRAIRILWDHLLQSFGMKTSTLKIIAVISNYKENTEIEEDYIYATIQLMSSAIASVDGIEIRIPHKDKKSIDFRRRIARNLHQLASLESKMDMVRDPMKGSYFIEAQSNQYAKEAWNKYTI